MLNLHHLTVFHAVALTGSVSRGAERLMVSQPAVSKQLRQLERAIGASLFDRHARGVSLTAAGRVLAEYAARVFALVGEAERAVGDIRSLRGGSVSIGAGPTVGVYLLPWAIVQFQRRFPHIRVHMETELADVLRQRILDGIVDLALTEAHIAGPNLTSRIFAHDLLVPIAAAKHPLAAHRRLTAKEFCRHPFISRQIEPTGKSLVQRTLAERGLEPIPSLTVGTTEAIKQAVIAGLGVAMVSRLAIRAEVAAGQLVELPVSGLPIRYPIYNIFRTDRSESAAAKAFLSTVAEIIRPQKSPKITC
jgi:DNA-binding transcriptional LysR family regulator